MSSVEKVKIIATLGFLGGGLLFNAFISHKRKRMVQDTARSATSSAAQGLVELEGFAWASKNPIPLPSQFEGVFYQFKLEKLVSEGSGKNRRRTWRTVFTKVIGDEFYLVDNKGLALVNCRSAETHLDDTKPILWRNMDTNKKNYILNNIIDKSVASFPPSDSFFGLFSESFRIIENEIRVGSPVYVRGHFTSQNTESKDNIFLKGLKRFLSLVYINDGNKLKDLKSLMDSDKDNKLEDNEALHGYPMLAQTSKRYETTNNTPEEAFTIYGAVTANPVHKLIVANAHEHHLVERLEKFLYFKFAGGIALTSLAIMVGLTETKFFEPNNSPQYSTKPNVKNSSNLKNHASRSVASLHEACTQSQLKACEDLLADKNEFRLSNQHINYYQNKACQLGSQIINCK